MIKIGILLAAILAHTVSGHSLGWPGKDELPNWLEVDLDVPPRWGTPGSFDLNSCVRVTLRNTRESEVRILNESFRNPRFLRVKKDGSTIPLENLAGQLRTPSLNPGITLGAHSTVGIEIELNRVGCPAIPEGDVIMFELEVSFVAGDVVQRLDSDGRVIPNVGMLDGYTYVVVCKLADARRLLR